MGVILDDPVEDLVVNEEVVKLIRLSFILVGTSWFNQLENVPEGNHLLLEVQFEVLQSQIPTNIVED